MASISAPKGEQKGAAGLQAEQLQGWWERMTPAASRGAGPEVLKGVLNEVMVVVLEEGILRERGDCLIV